ncbi:MAG: DUF1674 domain-containing protein [Gammaproteobacteria bacterium]|nr:DUF1674 domain-containing protein [Gammaproteobacteria bacterium]
MSQQESRDKPTVADKERAQATSQKQQAKEYGGPKGKEPTRYGDWEKNGRCIDF